MHKLRGITVAFIMVFLCYTQVNAIQMQSSNEDVPDDVIGQVTITNVDSTNNSKKLNGAYIKITDKESDEEYTEQITNDGKLVYKLPLGSYLLTQELAPNEYELNSRVYEFTLQIPPNADSSNIKVVNASVMLMNEPISSVGDETHTFNELFDAASQTAEQDVELTPKATQLVTPVSPADKNPATTDISNGILGILVILVMILLVCIVSLKKLQQGKH